MSRLVRKRDLQFLLYEWLQVEKLCQSPSYQMHDKDVFDGILDTAYQSQNKNLPHMPKSST